MDVTIAAVKVASGDWADGVFVTLDRDGGEEYHCTLPTAYIHGWLRASLSLAINGSSTIKCAKTGISCEIIYHERVLLIK